MEIKSGKSCWNRQVRNAFKPHRQDGAIAIMALGALIILCGFCGLMLDLSRVFNRKVEMQNAADAGALAAGAELNGTRAGIANASQKANSLFAIPLIFGGPNFGYGREAMNWSDDAIVFATSPGGPWISRAEAAGRSEPNGLLYAKVDSAKLDASYGELSTWFMPVISDSLSTVSTSAHAIAGPSGIAITPLGLCIMGSEAKRNRNGELEEYGFRRGVSYDLMQLNPNDANTGQSFLLHPFAAPGGSSAAASSIATVASFVCTGTMGVARVTGASIPVSSPFPLAELYQQLNSRFDSYTQPCNPDTAPPDKNIKSYTFNNSGVPWMGTAPEGQASRTYQDTANGKSVRWTVAGPDPTPLGTTAVQYGPLWSYAKAVRYADPAPTSGYVAYTTANWSSLYTPGQPSANSSYPTSTVPYLSTGSAFSRAPSRTGVRDRRVLNVALLACPVSGGRATVKGVGRFFMTVPADNTHLYAEFAGTVEEQTLRTRVRLHP